MIVLLSADGCTVSDPDDCTRLHVHTLLTQPEATAALREAELGVLGDDGSHAFLDLSALRARALGAARSADWDGRWRAMVDYATSKGWVTADGAFVRAHVEGPPRTGG